MTPLVTTALHVSTPQGASGVLSKEDQYLFGYDTVAANAAVSISMPVRRAQYAHAEMQPIFQMNLPEGFLLEELRNRFAKVAHIDPMLLLSMTGGHAPIGRVKVSPITAPKDDSAQAEVGEGGVGESLSEILAWDGAESLFDELVNKYIHRSGISGVQPKVLVPQSMNVGSRVTASAHDLIVKSGRQEYPGLAANEFLCMSIAKAAGMAVPDFYLSANKELFVMRRFDRLADGKALGFEDMAVLAGWSPNRKYSSNYTHIANLVTLNASPAYIAQSLTELFEIVALSVIVGNGDAHLKNFGLIYTDPTSEDCRLAPAFDIVNTTAYLPQDVLALDLCGHKTFFAAQKGLLDFAKICGVADPTESIQKLILTAEFILQQEDEIACGIPHVVAAMRKSIGAMYNRFLK